MKTLTVNRLSSIVLAIILTVQPFDLGGLRIAQAAPLPTSDQTKAMPASTGTDTQAVVDQKNMTIQVAQNTTAPESGSGTSSAPATLNDVKFDTSVFSLSDFSNDLTQYGYSVLAKNDATDKSIVSYSKSKDATGEHMTIIQLDLKKKTITKTVDGVATSASLEQNLQASMALLSELSQKLDQTRQKNPRFKAMMGIVTLQKAAADTAQITSKAIAAAQLTKASLTGSATTTNLNTSINDIALPSFQSSAVVMDALNADGIFVASFTSPGGTFGTAYFPGSSMVVVHKMSTKNGVRVIDSIALSISASGSTIVKQSADETSGFSTAYGKGTYNLQTQSTGALPALMELKALLDSYAASHGDTNTKAVFAQINAAYDVMKQQTEAWLGSGVIQVTDATGGVKTITYSKGKVQVEETISARTLYDSQGRILQLQTRGGDTTKITWGSNSAQVTSPNGDMRNYSNVSASQVTVPGKQEIMPGIWGVISRESLSRATVIKTYDTLGRLVISKTLAGTLTVDWSKNPPTATYKPRSGPVRQFANVSEGDFNRGTFLRM